MCYSDFSKFFMINKQLAIPSREEKKKKQTAAQMAM